MRRFTFLFFLTLLSSLMWTSVNAQQYCAAAGSDTQVENITNVTFAGINNTTTTHLGYNDFTGLVAQVAQGEQQQLSVTINAFIGGGDFVYAFIDWNGNGTLDDVGEVYTLATNTFSSWSYTLNVTAPNDAVSGNIRMRIIIAYDKINPDPCGNFDFGEVEDYTISITPPLAACPTGDFTFYSQAEIDAFGTTYGHCTEIPGNVLIQGGDITNLDGLSALESIGWNLIIRNNSQLTNLDGLSNLTEIGGNLIIRNNSQLTNLDGLSNLTEIGGDLDIYNNSQLTNLDGLSALESINGYLVIYNNAVLTDISGLQNIDPATILPTYDLGLYIENNPLLSVCNLDNFCTYLAGSGPRTISGNAGDCVSVTAVTTACTTSQEPQCPTGDVALYSQTDVNNFATNYPNCTEITGNLQISGSNITDLSPLNNIQSVGGYLNIESNSQLTNLDGLSNLTQIGGFLAFQSNDILENLDGLGNLTQIGGYLNIYYNSQLTNLDGLGNLTQIGGNLYITSNSQLTNLDGLSALESINGSLFIYDNPVLTDISGLQNIDPATILSTNGLGLYIQYNPLLSVCNLDNFCTYLAGSGPRTISGNAGDCVSVTAVTTACTTSQEPQCPTGDVILTSQTQVNDFGTNYPNCTEITGNLYIGGSDITDLSPLSNIQSIGGYLNIQSNSQLTNLDGLSALESINGDLVIYNNPVLTDISGLQNIDPATILPTYSSGLYIQNNPLLSVCNLDNFCTYLAGSGPRTISGNAGDCVSVTAVTTACTTSQEPQCPTGDVALYSQTDVNNFATNYPNCTEITGYLYISGSDITDLSPLSNIQSVGGYLQINNNSQLTNLDGLSNLTQIGGYLYFQANSLTNLDGLSNLTQIGGDLNIQSNSQLTNLDGLSNLTEIGGYLFIYYNSQLTNLDGLSNLTQIGGYLNIQANSQLTNLDGLSALESINGDLIIYNNTVLTDISGLESLDPDTINILHIESNLNLSVCNLPNFCTYLQGSGPRIISQNAGDCVSVTAVTTACTTSQEPQCPTGDVYLASQTQVNDFGTNYPNCTEITGYLYIGGSTITDLSPLSNIIAVTGNLYAEHTSQLTSLQGLHNVASVGGSLSIYNNPQLNSVQALSNITSLGGFLSIYNTNLSSLEGLHNITAIDGGLSITSNAVLTDISALENIDPETITDTGLYIAGNSSLSVCNLSNFCAYLAGDGERTISGNLGTCYDVDTVVAACNASVYDCPDLELNIGDTCTDADGNEGTVDEDCNCYVEPTPAVCEWTVHIWDYSWGDEVTWSLKDKDGNVLLQGSYYGYDYDDTQTVTTEGPLKFTISNVGNHGDNMPNYTVSNGTEILAEGQLAPNTHATQVFTDLDCGGVTPPVDWDCPDLEANFGDACTDAHGDEGTVDENCECYVAPTCSAEWTGAVSEDWNTAANWCDNTVPTAGSNVVINNSNLAIIDINTVVTIESITLGAAANVTVNGLLNVGDITVAAGGSLVIANDANLLQSETATNTGNITVKRNTVIKHLDYTIWSSPVADQELEAFSPNTLASRIYQYNTSTDAWEVTAENFTAGKGIMFRAPNLFDDGNYPNAYTYEGVFTGTPHNGDISVSFSQVGEYQGVGNPYPSNIKITGADGFWNTNPTVGTLYFWTNTNAWDTGTGDYVANNWATYSNLGGLAAANSTKVPVDIISVGQGFVIKTPGLSSISFNNGMRIAQNSVFFRTIEEDKHRLWLNLSDSSSELNNILIGYMDGATQGEDLRIDSKMFNYNGSALYSLIESNGFAYTIQGRSLPFDDFDVVPLGFRATTSGAFTVSLSNFDGVFAQGQDIFLKDNLTQTQHNLKDSDYTFVSNQGEFTTRFEVVYRTSMDVTNPELSNAWAVYVKDKTFFIETQGIDLKEVMVYDMLGRVIYESQAQGNKHSFAQIGANQVLVIKVITTDNEVLTKKVSN